LLIKKATCRNQFKSRTEF